MGKYSQHTRRIISSGSELQLEIEKANMAVLSIRTFGYYDNQQKFYDFLDSAFEQIHHSTVQNLILDLRNNSGGDPVCAAHCCPISKESLHLILPVLTMDMRRWLNPSRWLAKNAFAGNLYVLINGGCFSTTGHFCALLKYTRRAKFVGEETGGTYECNDNHIRFKPLPHI